MCLYATEFSLYSDNSDIMLLPLAISLSKWTAWSTTKGVRVIFNMVRKGYARIISN